MSSDAMNYSDPIGTMAIAEHLQGASMAHTHDEERRAFEEMFSDMRTATIRTFNTGATRSPAEGKPEYAGYLHPKVIRAFGVYMLKHQTDSAGNQRDCRNHKRGIPSDSYVQSGLRHRVEWWTDYEDSLKGHKINFTNHLETVMADLFNLMGYASNLIEEHENG